MAHTCVALLVMSSSTRRGGHVSQDELYVAPRKPRIWMVDGVLDDRESWRSAWQMLWLRTNRAVFADLGSDFGVLHRENLVQLAVSRLVLTTLGVLIAVGLIGPNWRAAAYGVLLLLALTWSGGVALTGALALAPFCGSHWWLPPVAIIGGALYKQRIEPAREITRYLGSWRLISLVPLSEVAVLVKRRTRFTVASAFDMAASGFPERAAVNVSAAMTAVDDRTPSCRAMLVCVEAMIAYERNMQAEALALAERARQLSLAAAAGPRTWIMLQHARLLRDLGDVPAARVLTREAVLQTPSRSSGLLFEAHLQHAALARDSGEEQTAIAAVHQARMICVSRRDLLGLITTEVALLDVQAEAPEDTQSAVDWLVDLVRMEYRAATPVANQVQGVVEALAGELAIRRGERDTAFDHFARATLAFTRASDPILEALTLARFAELLCRPPASTSADVSAPSDEDLDNAIEFALLSIKSFNEVRYALPTSQWRQTWVQNLSSTYGLALRLSLQRGGHARAAGLVELAKSQAVPMAIDRAGAEKRQLLDSFLEARSGFLVSPSLAETDVPLSGEDTVRALISADPVHVPGPPLTAGESILPDANSIGLDIEATIRGIAGADAFYLTAAVTDDTYFWAFYGPSRVWQAGADSIGVSTAEGRAIDALLNALPVQRQGESATSRWLRASRSALYATNTPAARADEARLMTDAGRTLLPPALVSQLHIHFATFGVPRLLVSMPGSLAAIPFAFLVAEPQHLPATRLIDIADIQTVPTLQLVEHMKPRTPPQDTEWPLLVAAAFSDDRAPAVQVPPRATQVIDDRLDPWARKSALSCALTNGLPSQASVYLSGHLEMASPGATTNPLKGGLQLAPPGDERTPIDDRYLTVADLLSTGTDPARGFPLPDRVLIVACSSLGMIVAGDDGMVRTSRQPVHEAPSRWPLAGEWVGFSAACLLAGARLIVCTIFDQADDVMVTQIDHRLARVLELSSDPVRAVSAIQRELLSDWLAGSQELLAAYAMCYTVVAF